MKTARVPSGLVDERPERSTIELLRVAETKAEEIQAHVREIVCPACEPRRYLQLLDQALEAAFGVGVCDHVRYVPTPAGMAIVGEVSAP